MGYDTLVIAVLLRPIVKRAWEQGYYLASATGLEGKGEKEAWFAHVQNS